MHALCSLQPSEPTALAAVSTAQGDKLASSTAVATLQQGSSEQQQQQQQQSTSRSSRRTQGSSASSRSSSKRGAAAAGGSSNNGNDDDDSGDERRRLKPAAAVDAADAAAAAPEQAQEAKEGKEEQSAGVGTGDVGGAQPVDPDVINSEVYQGARIANMTVAMLKAALKKCGQVSCYYLPVHSNRSSVLVIIVISAVTVRVVVVPE
jgi:hypothetical protein